ncbi:RICIN domain-containing protein [Streptosporangium roseum]|uniref:RICIN domain-containing protein n=1 Tax=Streptosporangium roseum TaxID=2001 RepID=UPI0012DE011D|nr:RICIN domain-containing protein [Streptosporangium roseum]
MRSAWLKTASMLAVIASGMALTAGPAAATDGQRIQIATAGQCLDVKDFSPKNGAIVQLWRCNQNANQLWTMHKDGSIRNSLNGKCLDVRDFNSKNRAAVQMWKCTGNANQQWYWSSSKHNGYKTLRSRLNNRCLDATEKQSKNGTPLQIWACHGGWNQSFRWA